MTYLDEGCSTSTDVIPVSPPGEDRDPWRRCQDLIRSVAAASNVPAPLRGLGITFILVGLMSLGFLSFMGFAL